MTLNEEFPRVSLAEELTMLENQVRASPSQPRLRVYLFQLLAVMGQWQRALTQLKVAAEMDAANLAMKQVYQPLITCELFRAQVFAGQRSPLILGKPPKWLAGLIQALTVDAEGNNKAARELRDRAFDNASACAGEIDGDGFQWLADADQRLGPVLEVMINGKYYWVPMERINKVTLEEPVDLRDLVWMPAHFVWSNGGDAVGMIPTRYNGSEHEERDDIRLSRFTRWNQNAVGAYTGMGQRMLATDQNEYSLMDIRSITLNTVSEPRADTVSVELENE